MKKEAPEVAGYTILPLQLPSTPSFPQPATHYLYLRPHEPRIPDPETPRSLFIINLPIDTTELHLRHLFGAQLSAGRVERVHFEDVPTKKRALATATHGNTTATSNRNKKRKRVTVDDLQTQLDDIELPSTWDRKLQKSGSHAVVVFVDKPSMDASLKAAKKAAIAATSSSSSSTRKQVTITWGGDGGDIQDRLPQLGHERYLSHERLRYPDRADLLRTVNEYMTVFTQVAEARKREDVRKAAEPDEDGFVTVTSGARINSAAQEEELKELLEREKEKKAGLNDFYRFQSREKRKERQNLLLKRFDEDKKKLQDMKRRKGRIMPE